jgi:hypothetical protein
MPATTSRTKRTVNNSSKKQKKKNKSNGSEMFFLITIRTAIFGDEFSPFCEK